MWSPVYDLSAIYMDRRHQDLSDHHRRQETLTVGVDTNDNGTAGDTTDDFQELTYLDEERILNTIDLTSIIDAEETVTVIGVATNDNGTAGEIPPTIFRNSPIWTRTVWSPGIDLSAIIDAQEP